MKLFKNIIIALLTLVVTAQAERKLVGYKQGEGRFVAQPEYRAGDYKEAKAHADGHKWHNATFKPCMAPPKGEEKKRTMCQSTMGWMDYRSIVVFMDHRPKNKAEADQFAKAGVKNSHEMLRYCGGVWVKGSLWVEGEKIPIYKDVPEPKPAPVQHIVEAPAPAPVVNQPVNLHFYSRPEKEIVEVERKVYVGRVVQQERCQPRPQPRHCEQPRYSNGPGFWAWATSPVGGVRTNTSYYQRGNREVQFGSGGNTAGASATAVNQGTFNNKNTNVNNFVFKNVPEGMNPRVTQRRGGK